MLFGQFVGGWDVESHQYAPDGAERTLRGEWYFFWALEGRAIQDVIVAPRREARRALKLLFDYLIQIKVLAPPSPKRIVKPL